MKDIKEIKGESGLEGQKGPTGKLGLILTKEQQQKIMAILLEAEHQHQKNIIEPMNKIKNRQWFNWINKV